MAVPSRYRLARRIKGGGMAEVYEAYIVGEQGFERRVAVKKLRAASENDTAFMNSFVDEARIASQMHHANIVAVLDFGAENDVPYQVLEYVDGLDLEELRTKTEARGQRITPEIALAIITEVAHGLGYAHAATDPQGRNLDVVHRDVSPPNVLISWAGEVKLSDFGIALATSRLEQTALGVAKGKLGYMAPEQVFGDEVDGRADLFALGCLLQWLVTGRSPMDEAEIRDQALTGQDPPVDSGLPSDLITVVRRATRFNPDQRYATAADMADACGTALAKRLRRDPRSHLRDFMTKLHSEEDTPQRSKVENGNNGAVKGRQGMFFPDLDTSPTPMQRHNTQVWDEPTSADDIQTALVLPSSQELALIGLDAPSATESDAPAGPYVRPVSTPEAFDPAPPGDNGDELIGTVLHGYRLEARLGTGALAHVYKARHMVLERAYAVKILYGAAAVNDEALQRLQREAQL
ncbi:MAG: protein kinase, partial [Myxococcota bacterium]